MLSTWHSDDFVETKEINYQIGRTKWKAKCVADYNALMGAAHGLTSDNAALKGLIVCSVAWMSESLKF